MNLTNEDNIIFLTAMELGKYDIVLLYSGGLDSVLSAKLLRNAGVSVLAVQFIHPFGRGLWRPEESLVHNEEIDIDILYVPVGEEFLKLVENPPHGRGSNANTCIDCRIYFLRRAKMIFDQVSAKLMATGEVIGQRPMSQNLSAIRLIERKSGFERKIFRPLSAKTLPPTIPEISTLTEFSDFQSFKGRSRKPQMELAEKLGIENYQTPAGGCLLTDPGYSRRFLEALANGERITFSLTQLLKLGRLFRINGKRLVVARSDAENRILVDLFSNNKIIMHPTKTNFPVALLDSGATDEQIKISAQIVARYSHEKDGIIEISLKTPDGKAEKIFSGPMEQQKVEKFLL